MADVRLRRIAHLAAALLVVTAQAGCGQPNTEVTLLGLHCVPTKAASGWRVDVFVKLQIASLADAPLRIEDEQFTLVTSAGEVAANVPPPEAPKSHSVQMPDASTRYANLPLLSSRRLNAGESTIGWIRFNGVLPLRQIGSGGREVSAARRALFDGLAAIQPQLRYHSSQGRTMIDLQRFTALPDPLHSRPSALCPAVTVIDLPDGLSGFQFAVMEQRLKTAGYTVDDKVLLLLTGPVDPCFSEWWPPEPGQLCAAELAVAGTPRDPAAREPMDSEVQWKPMTRSFPVLSFDDEPRAVAQMLQGAAQQELLDQWRTSPDPRLRRVAVQWIRQQHPNAVANLLQSLADDPDLAVRVAAVQSLVQVGPKHLGDQREAVAEALGKASETPDAGLRRAVLGAACSLRCPTAVLPVARRMLDDRDLVHQACLVIAAAKDKESVPKLLSLAAGGNGIAGDALAEIADESSLPAIREMVNQDLAAGRGPLVRLLGRVGNQSDGARLAAAWNDTLPQQLKLDLLTALGQLGGEPALQRILKVAEAEDPGRSVLLREALKALRPFRDDRAVPLWEKLALENRYRSECLDGLSYHGGAAAKEALKRLADADDHQLRLAARRALGW